MFVFHLSSSIKMKVGRKNEERDTIECAKWTRGNSCYYLYDDKDMPNEDYFIMIKDFIVNAIQQINP
jgi:hypothetical protein